MAVHDIAYVELFTRDKVSAVDYLVSAMGFTRVADSVEYDRSSVLLRQGEVQVVVTSGRGIWKFLDEHGDGVADLALTCDDVEATAKAATAAAQAAEPQALVSPAPRSQVRMTMWLRETICASVILARSGNIG